jgi:hypothetical protein
VVTAWLEGTIWWEVTAWLEVTVSVDATVVVVKVEAVEFARLGALRYFIAEVAAQSAESESAFTGFGRPCLGGSGGGSSMAEESSNSSLPFEDFLLVSQKWPEDFAE